MLGVCIAVGVSPLPVPLSGWSREYPSIPLAPRFISISMSLSPFPLYICIYVFNI